MMLNPLGRHGVPGRHEAVEAEERDVHQNEARNHPITAVVTALTPQAAAAIGRIQKTKRTAGVHTLVEKFP